jgi:superfamily II DNA or RNA helicase
MYELYDYQQKAVAQVHEVFANGIKRVCLQKPTGAGKTVVFTHIASMAAKRFKRVTIISHRIELLSQAGGTMQEFGINPQLITAKTKHVHDVSVSIAMTGTLKNRLDKISWRKWWDKQDLIIIDECHRSDFNWLKDYEQGKYKIGVTATPLRSGKMPQLSSEYDALIEGLQVKELIQRKKLVPDYYVGLPVEMTGVKKDSYGEYQNEAMFDKFNTTKCYAGIVDNWVKYANGLCTIVFCINIQHCIKTAEELDKAGIKAKFITSQPAKPNLPKNSEEDDPASWTKYRRKTKEFDAYVSGFSKHSGNREDVINEWKRGEFPVLINAGIAVEGFDHKPIMCVAILLATTSLNKWLQMVGRGSRIYTSKEQFVLLDFGGNADRLGHYQANRQWALNHDERISTGNTPYKNCPTCDSLIFVASVICEFCGYEYPEKKEAEFIELVAAKTEGQNARTINSKEMSHKELEVFAQQKGYKSNWIWRTIYANEKEEGLKTYAKHKGYSVKWVKLQVKSFAR